MHVHYFVNRWEKKDNNRIISKKKIRKRKRLEDTLPMPDREKLDFLAQTLVKQIDAEEFRRKYAPIGQILKLVGAGVFVTTSLIVPNLPKALKPYLSNSSDREAWKRFNIPYLKRTLKRLEEKKLVDISNDDQGRQVVKITDRGRKRILRVALDELVIEKPKKWNGYWYLVGYDLPVENNKVRNILREYLRCWGFYP